jgi:hypothetical protein
MAPLVLYPDKIFGVDEKGCQLPKAGVGLRGVRIFGS